ncbi:MAG: hypothetical protein IJW15_04945 [Clostridia bacterium]|nr:hypothetical protein [Clostridia bacterium]
MKKFISTLLTILMLLASLSITPIAAESDPLPNNVTLKSIVCNSSGTTVTAKMTFDAALDCTVILAVYDNSGKLLNVTYEASPTTATDFSISLSGYANHLNCSAKIFFWDTLNTLKPLNASLSGTVEPIPSYLAVIEEIGKATDNDGEDIWDISYLLNSDSSPVATTPEVATGSMPTPGDIVKLEFDDSGLISSIKYVWNFDENVRSFTTNEPVSLATGDDAYIITNPDETLAGGVVTAFDDSKDIATINGTEYNLKNARNIYVITKTRRDISARTGSLSNFTYFPALYTTQGNITITDSNDNALTFDMSTQSYDAQKFADHIYVRTYEGKVEDVIIVKGADIEVSAN